MHSPDNIEVRGGPCQELMNHKPDLLVDRGIGTIRAVRRMFVRSAIPLVVSLERRIMRGKTCGN